MKRFFYFVTISIVMFSSATNAQWITVNNPNGYYVRCLAVGGINLFAGTVGGGIFFSTNDGTSWQAINNGLGDSIITSLATDGSNIFAGTYRDISNSWSFYRGKIFYSTNSGANWLAADTSFPDGTIKCFAINESNIFAGVVYMNGGSQIYFSTNTGISWEMVFGTPSAYSVISNLIINDSNVFAGTSRYHSLFLHSSNNGQSFSIDDSALSSGIYALARIGNNLFAGTGYGVYLSTNSGLGWSPVNNGLPDYVNNYGWITTLAVSPDGAGGMNLIAGTDSAGVFLSTNNGTSWSSIGLSENHVRDLTITDTSLFAVTYSGIWRRSLSEITSVSEISSSELPESFELKQNYPNSFNPTTTISFSISTSEFVTLKVYDVLGNEVAALVNEEKPVGNYEVNFNASQLSSGIYFYSLQTGSFIETKKMILLK